MLQPGRHHLAGEGLGGQQGADEVQVEHHLYAALVEVEEGHGIALEVGHLEILFVGVGAGVVAAGTVHQNIAGAKFCHHVLSYLQAVGLVHDVAGVAPGDAAFGLDLVGQSLELFHIAAQQATFAPARARALAKMEHRVPLAPVTTATLPVRSVFSTFCSMFFLFTGSAAVLGGQLVHALPPGHGLFQLHAACHSVAAAGVDRLDLLHLLAGQGVAFMAIRVAAQATIGMMQNSTMTTQFIPGV